MTNFKANRGSFKRLVRNYRDAIFNLIEKSYIHLINRIQIETNSKFIIIFTERNGRGFKESLAEINFVRSLKRSGFPYKVFKYNNPLWIIDSIVFLSLIIIKKPSQVIYTQRMKHHVFPSNQILSFITSNTNIYQINFWMDSHNRELWKNMIEPGSEFTQLEILNDRPDMENVPLQLQHKTIFHPCPYDLQNSKDVDGTYNSIFFSGSIGGSVELDRRKEYLDFAAINGLKIQGYDPNNPNKIKLNYEDYSHYLSNSLISLNFSWYSGGYAINGRTWETLKVNTLLIENQNPLTEYYLIPDVHYINFLDKFQMVSKIKYFQKNQEEAKSIAWQGYLRSKEIFSNDDFWKRIIRLTR